MPTTDTHSAAYDYRDDPNMQLPSSLPGDIGELPERHGESVYSPAKQRDLLREFRHELLAIVGGFEYRINELLRDHGETTNIRKLHGQVIELKHKAEEIK